MWPHSLSWPLQHVQMLLALNLVEVMRVYAPNAPYLPDEMLVQYHSIALFPRLPDIGFLLCAGDSVAVCKTTAAP